MSQNNVDNGAFTIASASKFLKEANALRVDQGLPASKLWTDMSERIRFPKSPSNITLEYEGMNNDVAIKQADVVLLTYPLDFSQNYTTEDKLLDLDYVSFLFPVLFCLMMW